MRVNARRDYFNYWVLIGSFGWWQPDEISPAVVNQYLDGGNQYVSRAVGLQGEAGTETLVLFLLLLLLLLLLTEKGGEGGSM